MSRLADLAKALCLADAADATVAASLAGYRRDPIRALRLGSEQGSPPPPPVDAPPKREAAPDEQAAPTNEASDARVMRFWRIVRREEVPVAERASLPGVTLPFCDAGDPLHTPPVDPIQPWSRLWPKLRRLIADEWDGRAPDIDTLVAQMSRGETVTRIPRRRVRRWPRHLCIWVDTDTPSVPLWADRNRLIDQLSRWCAEVRFATPDQAARRETVLRLGDLPAGAIEHRAAKGRACALVARPAKRRGWRTLNWSASPATKGDPASRAEALLVLMANLTWVQPGLLRALRGLLPSHEADISTEMYVWRRLSENAQPDGMTLDPARMRPLAARYARLTDAVKREVCRLVTLWHAKIPEELRHFESLRAACTDPARPLFNPAAARAFLTAAGDAVLGGRRRELVQFAAGTARFLMAHPKSDRELRRAIDRLWYAGNAGKTITVPCEVSAEEESAVLDGTERKTKTLSFAGMTIGVQPGLALTEVVAGARDWWVTGRDGTRAQVPAESPIDLTGRDAITLSTGFERIELKTMKRPYWADSMIRDASGLHAQIEAIDLTLRWVVDGEGRWVGPDGVGADDFGIYEDVTIAGVPVRFRLIPAGTFMMGSPKNEEGRWADEGPQHEVTLTQPFWLAEAPVTQALWQAVMGKNPARFKGADRPVEQVSWDDVTQFVDKVEQSQPGLAPRLPTEAQWEYACRAGTATPRYGELDAVAWHTGNSDGETHPVKQKNANDWGLYDMLGNVEEWCADYWHNAYEPGAATDPTGAEEGSSRVFRGGSWNRSAGFVRAACRDGYHPGIRYRNLGFRLSRGPGPSARSAERAEPASQQRSESPARSDGAEGQARSAGGGASPEGPQTEETKQAKRSIFSRLFGRKKGEDEP